MEKILRNLQRTSSDNKWPSSARLQDTTSTLKHLLYFYTPKVNTWTLKFKREFYLQSLKKERERENYLGGKTEKYKCWRKKSDCWWECKLVHPLFKTLWSFLKKLKMEITYDPVVSLPRDGLSISMPDTHRVSSPLMPVCRDEQGLITWWSFHSHSQVLTGACVPSIPVSGDAQGLTVRRFSIPSHKDTQGPDSLSIPLFRDTQGPPIWRSFHSLTQGSTEHKSPCIPVPRDERGPAMEWAFHSHAQECPGTCLSFQSFVHGCTGTHQVTVFPLPHTGSYRDLPLLSLLCPGKHRDQPQKGLFILSPRDAQDSVLQGCTVTRQVMVFQIRCPETHRDLLPLPFLCPWTHNDLPHEGLFFLFPVMHRIFCPFHSCV